MTIQITQWSPDHCACVLNYSWNDADSEDTRVHTAAGFVTQCAVHAGMAVGPHYAAVLEENQRKNRIYAAILANLPALTQISADGVVTLKNGVTFTYLFDGVPGARHVTITVAGATLAQITAMQNWADAHIGVGKVTVQ